MKSKFIKLSFIFALLITLLFVPFVQTFVLKSTLSIFIPYKLEKVENLEIKFFPFKIQSSEIQIFEKQTNNKITFNKIEINFRDSKWNFLINEMHYFSKENQEFVDMTAFTPEILAKFLQQSFVKLKNIFSVKIQKFLFSNYDIKVSLEQKNNQIIGNLSDGLNEVNLACDESQIMINGSWNNHPIEFQCDIQKNSIIFSGKLFVYNFFPEFFQNHFGEQLFFEGVLAYNQEWNLESLKLNTTGGHKFSGSCTQKRAQLNGLFIWSIPKTADNSEITCQITIKGFAQQPNINLQFINGIQPLESLQATIDIISKNHMRFHSNAFYNKKNQALCKFDIHLDPFMVDGDIDCDVQDLEKFLGNFMPSIKGRAHIKGKFKKCYSFNEGLVDLFADINAMNESMHLPLKIEGEIKNGVGKAILNIKNGKCYNLPLNINLNFLCNKNSIDIENFQCSLAELNLNLLKAFTYNFETGSNNVNFKCLGGKLTLKNILLSKTFKDSEFVLSFDNIQMKNFSKLLENSLLSGVVNAELIKSANQNAKASVVINNLNWQKREESQIYKVIEKFNCKLQANADDQQAEWKLTAQDNEKINLNSSGKINLSDYNIDGFLKGFIKLKLLNDWLASSDRIYGDINLNVSLKGDFLNPTFEGFINADNGLYEHNEVGTYYQNITIRTEARGKKFLIKQFTAQDVRNSKDSNLGQLNGDGWLDLNEILNPEFNINLHMLHLRIAQHDGFISDASGTLSIVGKGTAVGCKGEATLENATYFVDQGAEGRVSIIEDRNNKKNKNKKITEYAKAFPLDILIHAPENALKVIGMGANTIWQGDFYVKKSIANPFLVGGVTLQEGTLEVLGKVLKITKGKINFVEDDRNNPRLDIVASQDMGDGLTVSLEIKGTGDNTIIDFTSNPQLQKEEVLSLLVFGKRLGEVSVLQSMQLATLVKEDKKQGDSFLNKLRKGFGFDELEFKTVTRGGASENDKDATPQERAAAKTSQALRIGKDFGKVRVAVEQGAGTESSKVVVSTPLGKNLALQGDVGSAQNSGVGINWIKRY